MVIYYSTKDTDRCQKFDKSEFLGNMPLSCDYDISVWQSCNNKYTSKICLCVFPATCTSTCMFNILCIYWGADII